MEQEKEPILMLVHRIPYPPNKGDKIRSFHLLRHLSKNFAVHLGCFIDDPRDLIYRETLKQWCTETKFIRLHADLARVKSLRAFIVNQPLSFEYYRSSEFQTWVSETLIRYHIKKIIIFSSAMAQFVENATDCLRLIDFVDVDSDKWRQYASQKKWPMRSVYRREAAVLLQNEVKISEKFDASFFVSEKEATLFSSMAPHLSQKISFFNNGVDTHYFCPERTYSNPYPNEHQVIVFAGAMDYWPNIDAVRWFANEVFTELRSRNPNLFFYIVGSRPTAEVMKLQKMDGIVVTGSVPDVRPFVANATLSVAPLRIARGIQNKVLEAMAMAKIAVVTPQALEGIDAISGQEVLLAENAEQYVEIILALLDAPVSEIGSAARRKVLKSYNWEANFRPLDSILADRQVDINGMAKSAIHPASPAMSSGQQ